MSVTVNFHDTTVESGRDEDGPWVQWVCTCGAGDDGFADRRQADSAARAHRMDAS